MKSEKQAARREQILDIASEIFLQEGYAAASVSSIAAKVGGSKGTLYAYFRSKEELFAAYVERHCEIHRNQMSELLTEEGEARVVLAKFAKRYVRMFTSERTLSNWRVISAESAKSPEIGRLFYEAGPLRGARILADYLDNAVARGELKIGDTLVAAHQFTSLIHGRMIKAMLLNYIPTPTDAEIDTEVEAAMYVFCAAYGTDRP